MIQEIPYAGWKRNLLLQGPTTELVITLDVGPRVIRYAFRTRKTCSWRCRSNWAGSGEGEWKIRGGHRFWTAPEGDHSYSPDNIPVTYKKLSDTSVEIVQAPDKAFGFQKTLRVEMLPGEVVKMTHVLANTSGKTLALSPWTLSVMAPGGVALIPQPPLDLHPSEFPGWPRGEGGGVSAEPRFGAVAVPRT